METEWCIWLSPGDVRKLTQTPSEVGRADAQAIYDAGWSEDAFLDVVTICVLLQLF